MSVCELKIFWRDIVFGLVLGGVTVFWPTPVLAQTLPELPSDVGKHELSLRGLSRSALLERFGNADSVEAQSPEGLEIWRFGESAIYLSNEQVSAWSDQGELRRRELLHRIKRKTRKGDEVNKDGWLNAWTPQHRPQPADVIKDLELDPATRQEQSERPE